MWGKLLLNSFRRDRRRKIVAVSAVALATSLATFLLNWSLNLGDRIQEDLRNYGSNIVITPQGDALPFISGEADSGVWTSDRYMRMEDLNKLDEIFWKNQILGMAVMLPQPAVIQGQSVTLMGTEYGRQSPVRDLERVAPYLSLTGEWPAGSDELVAGGTVARKFGLQIGSEAELTVGKNRKSFRITGIVSSGSQEENQLFATLESVQQLSDLPGSFKQLYISALVTAMNDLYFKHERDPKSLTPQENERYYCTPYITSVAAEVTEVFPGSEFRVVRQVSQSEEKIVKKVNWLMFLVTLAALVASSLTMTSTTTAMILERRKELALMKALGSSNSFVVVYLFSEILILGVLGSCVGYFLGGLLSVGLSNTVFQVSFEPKWIVLPLVCLIGVVIIIGGSLWPLRNAVSLQPAHALKDL